MMRSLLYYDDHSRARPSNMPRVVQRRDASSNPRCVTAKTCFTSKSVRVSKRRRSQSVFDRERRRKSSKIRQISKEVGYLDSNIASEAFHVLCPIVTKSNVYKMITTERATQYNIEGECLKINDVKVTKSALDAIVLQCDQYVRKMIEECVEMACFSGRNSVRSTDALRCSCVDRDMLREWYKSEYVTL